MAGWGVFLGCWLLLSDAICLFGCGRRLLWRLLRPMPQSRRPRVSAAPVRGRHRRDSFTLFQVRFLRKTFPIFSTFYFLSIYFFGFFLLRGEQDRFSHSSSLPLPPHLFLPLLHSTLVQQLKEKSNKIWRKKRGEMCCFTACVTFPPSPPATPRPTRRKIWK